MFFIGIDLAFSSKNNTGIVILEGPVDWKQADLHYVGAELCKDDDEILNFIMPYVGGSIGQAVLAIDAPLIVNNDAGIRDCERFIGQKFGSRKCTAYPSHKNNMAGRRGPQLIQRLRTLNVPVRVEPTISRSNPDVYAFETYPHAGHLAMFDLPAVWKYKKKQGRIWEMCRSELVSYWRAIEKTIPSTVEEIVEAGQRHDSFGSRLVNWIPAVDNVSDPPDVKGVRYKEFEDLTDALFCAYTAAHIAAGKPKMLFSPNCPGVMDAANYQTGDDFILIPAR